MRDFMSANESRVTGLIGERDTRTYIDIRDSAIRLLKCLGNLTDCVFYHVGRGIPAEGKGQRYQDRARTEV